MADENTQSSTTKDFVSAPELVEIARAEYQNEITRTSTIDTKAGIMTPIVATYFFLVLQHTDIKRELMKQLNVDTIVSFLYSALPALLYLGCLVLSAISLFFLFKVITTERYDKIAVECFFDPKTINRSIEEFSAGMVAIFIDAITTNSATNNRRVVLYSKGWRCALVSLICFILYIFLKH